jgi:hypothetical protein
VVDREGVHDVILECTGPSPSISRSWERVNADCYCTTLQHMKENICRTCPSFFRERVTVLHNKAHPHTDHIMMQPLQEF